MTENSKNPETLVVGSIVPLSTTTPANEIQQPSKSRITARRHIPEIPVVLPESEGKNPVSESESESESEFYRPVVVSVFNPITNQGRTLATIDEFQVPWLEAVVALLKTIPAASGGRNATPAERRLLVPAPNRVGRKGKPVVVLAVEEGCDTAMKPLDEFDSAASASRSLGMTYNGVMMALNNSAQGSVKVRGVTFQYEEDYMAALNASLAPEK